MIISMIACIAKNYAIGYNNQLLYHIPHDMKRFKALTTGHCIIMGKKTYESLPHGALPNRRNIVISHHQQAIEGCETYVSIEQALDSCSTEQEVFIIGGESIYAQTINMAHLLYLTIVEDIPSKADSFFPVLDIQQWDITKKETYQEASLKYTFATYRRKE